MQKIAPAPETGQSSGLVENYVMLTELRQQNLPVLLSLVNFPVRRLEISRRPSVKISQSPLEARSAEKGD